MSNHAAPAHPRAQHQKFSASEHDAIQELTHAIFTAAWAVAAPVQAQIVAPSQREKEHKWLSMAYDALSFYIVLATRMAQTHDVEKAQIMLNAVGHAILPELATRFYSRNPPDVQQALLDSFLVGHHNTETEYADCERVVPRTSDECNADSVFLRFADKLLAVTGCEYDLQARRSMLAAILASVLDESGAPAILMCVQQACDAIGRQGGSSLEHTGSTTPGLAEEHECPCGSGVPFIRCHGSVEEA